MDPFHFEKYEFPYENIRDAEVRAGELRREFDVLVMPSMSTDAIINGHRREPCRPSMWEG